MKIFRLIASLGVLVAMVGCGGNDGGSFNKPAPDPNIVVRITALQAAQEVPPVTAVGLGSSSLSVNADTLAISGSVSTTAVTGTAAHIHDGPVGSNGPIIIGLTAGPTAGTWVVPPNTILTADQFAKFQTGGLYLNVHTAANPGGETRGQIGMLVKHVRMNGGQVSPAVTTMANGFGYLAMHLSTGALVASVNLAGVTATAVTVSAAPFGTNGPAIATLTGGPTVYTAPAGTVLAGSLYSAFLGNQLYVTAVTATNPGGLIRGQVDSVVKIATMSGAAEVPPNATVTGTGSGLVMVNPATRGVAVALTTSVTNGTAGHIHNANAGANGPVIVPLAQPAPGVWVTAPGATLTEDQAARFFGSGLYLNIHTAAFPGGEVRGQINTNPG